MASPRYRYVMSCALLSGLLAGWSAAADSTAARPSQSRERLLMDFDWRFAFGHPSDTQNDFNHATGFFSYLAKAGYGDGPAAANYNDITWRQLNLPHDWAVELPFDANGSHSHGYKALGRKFPETSVGWYRKVFAIPESDLGRRISVEFDGVFRDSMVWINGHYLGRQPSGYTSFRYDITPYLNYGQNNTIAVRVDATMEEGWFYEGAGIYRHVWLVKTAPLHITPYGIFVHTETKNDTALVTVQTTVINQYDSSQEFEIVHTILDANGKSAATHQIKNQSLTAGQAEDFPCTLTVNTPKLWSLESPHLYKLVTLIQCDGQTVDKVETSFGIRTIHFDPDKGFFLNGKSVKLKGTNNHQDHAGVGAAIPDALQEFRIARLKDMGSNAYRCSHNPPTPELLDACDRLGMLVIDENRLMGTSPEIQEQLKTMILRDRNHPSVILWSLGNEEWAIEGNIMGARIASEMQAFAQRLDPTRRITVAISGGWGYGISTVVDVMGYNYISHGSTDQHHAKFPNQPGVGTEETTTQGTRGIYFDERPNAHIAALESGNSGGNCEVGWKHYADRPYLAGLFYWTGFDYRGEPTPFNFPAISSQCGILDTCGFPKDSFYYLKSWWTEQPVLHLSPHWTWPGKEGQELTVRCDSNCDEVELFCNDKSLGKKKMEANSHLEWKAVYQPGALLARGYKNGKEITTCRVETAGEPAAITLAPFRNTLKADGEDAAIITVEIQDAQGRRVPTADNDITFSIEGPARIIGVGNGNPSSHEPDVFLTQRPMRSAPVGNWTWKKVGDARRKDLAEITADFDDSAWAKHNIRSETGPLTWDEHGIFRSTAAVSESDLAADKVLLSFGCIDQQGWIYVNGKEAGQSMDWRAAPAIDIKSFLHPGTNSIAVAVVNFDGPGGINKGASLLFLEKPILPTWKRKTFNGLAQVIIQSTGQTGDITVTGAGEGLKPAVLKIPAAPATPRPSEPTLYRLKENSLSVAGGIITDNPELSDLSGNQLPEDKKPTIEAFENNAVSEKAHNENRMKAWKEAKFGLFLHWGVYSVYGGTYKGKELWSAEWIQENARIPWEEYSKTAASWNPSEFNAKEWVSYAKSAGMKYLVFTSRHHDGFAMYPSNASSYNLMDATQYKGPDPLAALKQACHEEGLLFGIYYSPLEFRGSPNGFDKEDEEAVKNGFSYKTLGPKPYATDDEIAALAKKQIRELIINYKPDILWFDGVWDKMGRWLRQDSQEVVKLIEELAPDTIINDRIGAEYPDFRTREGLEHIPQTTLYENWEFCWNLGCFWGYNPRHYSMPDILKTPEYYIELLVDIASKGGNYLLNVGPDAKGQFHPTAVRYLKAIGDWVRPNGQCIYGVDPSPFKDKPVWGYVTSKPGKLFLIVKDWPQANGKLSVPALNNNFQKAYFLTNPQKAIQVDVTDKDWIVHTAENTQTDPFTVIVVEVAGTPAAK